MKRHIGNPPPMPFGERRPRLVVRASKPKAFIWEMIQEDGRGDSKIVRTSSPRVYPTMEAAYEAGRTAMLE